MKVRSVRPHDNAYGESYAKPKGTVYEHPAPEQLIADGVVEEASDRAPLTPAPDEGGKAPAKK